MEKNIEKYDFEAFEKEQKPYTILINSVVQNIKNPQAFLMWAYLQSLPIDWKPSKHQLMKHFDIGERTYQKIMCYLNERNLIEYRRDRNSNGTLGKVKLIVLDGREFIPDEDFNHTVKNCVMVINHTAQKPQCGDSTIVVFGDVTNTIDLQTKNNKKNTTISDSDESPTAPGGKKEKEDSLESSVVPLQKKREPEKQLIEEVVATYHKVLPTCPVIKKIGTKTSELYRLIVKMIKNWHEYSSSQSSFTLEAFEKYLLSIKMHNPGFLQPYVTKEGNERRNNLKALIREDNILRFINGEFNFKKG